MQIIFVQFVQIWIENESHVVSPPLAHIYSNYNWCEISQWKYLAAHRERTFDKLLGKFSEENTWIPIDERWYKKDNFPSNAMFVC